ncbi:hypothetical protein IFM89_023969 [Coptis chinensis]|uniref:Reverse transcriptase zinc-binding domain-containing protein n=1 Tax=Coptis chinensis TaxID=261450 RepID=A0A835HM61_9MAGN|nr:hypothetical protein IFM89_023969 [Coptis chinensis]
MWQGAQEVIPTSDFLLRHHFHVDQECFLCRHEEESLHHLFIGCPFARALWFGSDLHSIIYGTNFITFKQWIEEVIYKCKEYQVDQDLVKKFAIVFWCIWLARNSARFQSKDANIMHFLYKVKSMLKFAEDEDSTTAVRAEIAKVAISITWQFPPSGWLKLNLDGLRLRLSGAGAGGVLLKMNMVVLFMDLQHLSRKLTPY